MHFLHFYIHNIIQPYTMTASDFNLSNLKVFLNHIYELKKGIRKMALFTTHSRNREFAVQRLETQGIDYVVQEVSGGRNVNIYFGAGECMEVVRIIIDRPLHMLSPEGRCKVFAADADGYVRSEGGAVVLLMRLSDALKQGLPIYAVIEDSLINQDGRTNGIALPNQAAQQALLHQIYAGRDLSSLVYLEAHGTGTAAGDPLECAAAGHELGLALKAQQDRPLYIGSVKSNVGHLETASGMAGLMKVLAMLKHQQIPAQLYADNLNPKIDFAGLNLKVSGQTIAFPKVNEPALIGLNSFGFGGSNAHVLLRRFDQDFEKIEV